MCTVTWTKIRARRALHRGEDGAVSESFIRQRCFLRHGFAFVGITALADPVECLLADPIGNDARHLFQIIAVEISDRMTGWTRFQTDPDDPVHPVNKLSDDRCLQMRSKGCPAGLRSHTIMRGRESDWPTHTCRDAPRNHAMQPSTQKHLGSVVTRSFVPADVDRYPGESQHSHDR